MSTTALPRKSTSIPPSPEDLNAWESTTPTKLPSAKQDSFLRAGELMNDIDKLDEDDQRMLEAYLCEQLAEKTNQGRGRKAAKEVWDTARSKRSHEVAEANCLLESLHGGISGLLALADIDFEDAYLQRSYGALAVEFRCKKNAGEIRAIQIETNPGTPEITLRLRSKRWHFGRWDYTTSAKIDMHIVNLAERLAHRIVR